MPLNVLPATRRWIKRRNLCWAQCDKVTALVGIAANLRAVPAAHVTFQFVDRRRLRPAHDIQRHRLVRVAPEAADLKVKIARVQSVAEAGRGLSGSFESEHALVPGDTRQPVSFLPSLGRALRRMPNRTPVNALSRFGAHQDKNAPAWRRPASRYRLGWFSEGIQGGRCGRRCVVVAAFWLARIKNTSVARPPDFDGTSNSSGDL
jgi:hypothetical protein